MDGRQLARSAQMIDREMSALVRFCHGQFHRVDSGKYTHYSKYENESK